MIRFFATDRPRDPQISLYLRGVIIATLLIYFFKQALSPGEVSRILWSACST